MRARPSVGISEDQVSDFVNFDGHFVISESFSPTNVPSSPLRTVTMTSRPSRNGSGMLPS